MRRWLLAVTVVILCLAPLADHLQAQSGPTCFFYEGTEWYGYPWGWIPINPVNNSNCAALWTIGSCRLPSPLCAPPDDETKPPCPGCGKPVSLATGNTFIEQNDVNLPGLGGGLRFTRRWNSSWPLNQISRQIGLFGANWRSTYEEYVFLGYTNYMKYSRSDGSYWSFGLTSGGWTPAAPANAQVTLVQTSTGWKMTFQNGETRTFDLTTGHLLTISDRNGNTTQVAYDSNNRLTTVTDAVGRTLSFSYASPSSFLVTGVTASVGSFAVTYKYDSSARLSQVVYPDQSTVNFAYDTNSLISSVTDSQGKVLESHTYDSNQRGLTSSQANGVNGVNITYPAMNPSWGSQALGVAAP
jgi:YD repeat-containing protein